MLDEEKTQVPEADWEPVSEQSPGDDALFEILRRNKKARRRKRIIIAAVVAVTLAAVMLAGVRFARQRVREEFMPEGDEVLSAAAERGTISTVVSGSGMILNMDTETVSVPSGVDVTEILVSFNDTVEENELLAAVDMASVRSAMAALQSEIDELDSQITAAEGDTVNSYIPAGVPGRVKILYAEKEDPVEDIMVDSGALAVLSLDGYMAVDIETDALAEGDTVKVVLSDGTGESGCVEAVVGGTATVLLTDDGPEYDEEVLVQTETGVTLGSGRLYIHNPLRITGYAGTVSAVYVSLNQQVYAASTVFALADTATDASFEALLRSRSEKEEMLLELLNIQRYNGITAPIAGSIYSAVDLDSLDEDEELGDIITISPDVSMSVTIDVDESDILSLELGQSADVTVSSVSDTVLTGTITEIDKTDSGGAYTAVVTLDKVEGMLPGMTADVDVRIEGADNVLLIPYDALHQSSSGYYVYTSYNEETQEYGGRVDVVPGLSNSNYVEIRSGLSEGDAVYYTEAEEMFGGMGFGGMDAAPGGQMSGGQSPGGMPGRDGGMPSGGDRTARDRG